MALVQSFRPDLNLVCSRIAPVLDLAVLRRWAIDTFRDPRYRPGMDELLDLRATADVAPEVGFETVREVYDGQRSWTADLRRDARIALVAPSDLVFGLARIYASLAGQDGLSVRPCRDWASACDTLGLDPASDLFVRRAVG